MIKSEHLGTFVRTKNRRFQTEQFGCYLCWKNFENKDLLDGHNGLHLHSVVIKNYNASWKALSNDDAPINCDIELISSKLNFLIKNNIDSDVTLKSIGVFTDMQFRYIKKGRFPLNVPTGQTVCITSSLHNLSGYNHFVIVYDDVQKHCERSQNYMVELNTHNMRITTNEIMGNEYTVAEQQPSEPAERNRSDVSAYRDATQLIREPVPDVLKVTPLPWYEPLMEVKELCNYSFLVPTKTFHPVLHHNGVFNFINEFGGVNRDNYFDVMSLSVQIEDVTARSAVHGNTKHNRQLIRRENGEFAVKLHPDEGRPLFLTAGDNVMLTCVDIHSIRHRAYVKKVTSTEILLTFRKFEVVDTSRNYSISFEVNRLTYQMERKALADAYRFELLDYLFPSEIDMIDVELPQLQYIDPKIKSDVNQIAAVRHIVAGTAYPYPYLLVGYPGTGKTKVIVESVCQLFNNSQHRILICSSCNTVCDEISKRIIKSLSPTSQHQTPLTEHYNILRLYANTVRRSCKEGEVIKNSNFDESIPCLDEIYKYRIVVCTLTVAGRLAQGQINKNHFTHLFIDESESASETYTLVPIVGVCSSYNYINAHIVLIGDPEQLGPMKHSTFSKQLKLNGSLFSRLYDTNELYKRNTRTGEYNKRFITKLRNNYRSHPKLVALPNKLFYSNEIRSSANPAHYKWYSELDFLPKPGVPILFEHIEGIPQRMFECVSWYNNMEIESVKHYVERLLKKTPNKREIKQSDIGIISPYKRQCINIEEMLEANNWTDVEVGSVEQFQGREKPIIIISTVRKGNMGFILERERINVMITRAIGLLIILGHRDTLMRNTEWRKVIQYANESCEGEMVLSATPGDELDEDDEEYGDVGDYRC